MFFEPSIAAIQEAIQEQSAVAHIRITVRDSRFSCCPGYANSLKSVLLVGGFAASPWLFSNLQRRLQGKGLRFYRPDGHLYVHDQVVSVLD